MEKYITAKVLAEKLSVRETTLANWRHRKQGPPYIKIEDAVRYPVSKVEAWIREQEVS